MTAPGQPVTLSPADLTAIRTALADKAHALRKTADSRRDFAGADRVVYRVRAGHLEDIAARLSFAVPGEPIQVVDQC